MGDSGGGNGGGQRWILFGVGEWTPLVVALFHVFFVRDKTMREKRSSTLSLR